MRKKFIESSLIKDEQTFQDYFFKQLHPRIITRLKELEKKRYHIETVEIDSDF